MTQFYPLGARLGYGVWLWGPTVTPTTQRERTAEAPLPFESGAASVRSRLASSRGA